MLLVLLSPVLLGLIERLNIIQTSCGVAKRKLRVSRETSSSRLSPFKGSDSSNCGGSSSSGFLGNQDLSFSVNVAAVPP